MKPPRVYADITGLLVIDKPKGWTSFDVVAKIRNRFNVKKIGHTGTLDPMATGVLVLCVGKATKLVPTMVGLDKEYIAEVTLGVTSNTDDSEGEAIPVEGAKPVSKSQLQTALKKFTGTFEQMPPQFSAKKVGGTRAYKMARKGREVELKAVSVTVQKMELLEYIWPVAKLRISVSKGFYVRSLARDIGSELGCGAYLSGLRRTRVGSFMEAQAISVEDADERHVIPLAE